MPTKAIPVPSQTNAAGQRNTPAVVDADHPTVIRNPGTATVYYKSTDSVSSTSNDGSLTTGQSLTLTGKKFLVGSVKCNVVQLDPDPVSKLTYDPETDSVDVGADNLTLRGAAVGGSSLPSLTEDGPGLRAAKDLYLTGHHILYKELADAATSALFVASYDESSGESYIEIREDGSIHAGNGADPVDAVLKRVGVGIWSVTKLGVGNSAAGSTPGTCVKKVQVYDDAGVSLGYVAVFDAIT